MTGLQKTKLDKIPKPVADIKVEAIEGELLLYHPRQTVAVYLNPTAAVIWGCATDNARCARSFNRLKRAIRSQRQHSPRMFLRRFPISMKRRFWSLADRISFNRNRA
jgi:hypothetical protein